jgi:type III secretion system (T3SS) SseB-like protein
MTDDLSAEDRGEADPALVAALASADVAAIRMALLAARVLVPIVALGEESTQAEMAVPRLVGADGRHALPVFSSYEALRAWRADARPVPMPGEQAVRAAVDEGYAAVVVDVAGPIPHTVEIRVLPPPAATL